MRAVLFPGQGSQKKGMGQDLFDQFDSLVSQADQILGFSVREVCLSDPAKKMDLTQYTQPLMFVVNAMAYAEQEKKRIPPPCFLAGHSLGEYNALAASGAIDFSTGLKLVQKRGRLMANAKNGGMAAIIGPGPDKIRDCLETNKMTDIEIANFNTPSQTVVSGLRERIEAAKPLFEQMAGTRYVILKVSGAFHASFMKPAALEFKAYLDRFSFGRPKIPVISNVLAKPYPRDEIKALLWRQMISPVRWMDSVRYMAGQGTTTFVETGPGRVLTRMIPPILKGRES
ncbi:MAG: ACP S-malonyltransferase [Desulfobacter sp.]|nr:ACP S-malonyltransferase [Desulfobacter sp.]WDP87064.1 MAG: ACP S-malonyltransferase [Desulfobacter sp.]